MEFHISFYILLVLTILWFCFMTWLSHQNGSETAETSRHLAEGLKAIFHGSVKKFVSLEENDSFLVRITI